MLCRYQGRKLKCQPGISTPLPRLQSCWPPLKGAGYKGACGAVTCPGLGQKIGWSCHEAVSSSILPLSSSWHLDLPFAGRDIPSLLCSESLETFLRRENQVTDLRLLGAQPDPISPGRISWIRHFLQCEQCQARAGAFGVDPANNSSFEHLT